METNAKIGMNKSRSGSWLLEEDCCCPSLDDWRAFWRDSNSWLRNSESETDFSSSSSYHPPSSFIRSITRGCRDDNNDGILASEHVRPFWIGEKASTPPMRLTNRREEYIITYGRSSTSGIEINSFWLLCEPESSCTLLTHWCWDFSARHSSDAHGWRGRDEMAQQARKKLKMEK